MVKGHLTGCCLHMASLVSFLLLTAQCLQKTNLTFYFLYISKVNKKLNNNISYSFVSFDLWGGNNITTEIRFKKKLFFNFLGSRNIDLSK